MKETAVPNIPSSKASLWKNINKKGKKQEEGKNHLSNLQYCQFRQSQITGETEPLYGKMS